MQKIAAPNIVPTTLTPLTPVEIISAQTSNLDMEVIEFTSSIQTPNLVSLFQNDPTITSISLPESDSDELLDTLDTVHNLVKGVTETDSMNDIYPNS